MLPKKYFTADVPYRNVEQLAALAVLALLIIGCLTVLRPFLTAILWGLIICLATWPAFEWLLQRLGNRATLAAACMTLLLAAALLVPLLLLGASLVENTTRLFEKLTFAFQRERSPPSWLTNAPLIGHQLQTIWLELARGSQAMLTRMQSFLLGPVKDWVLAIGANVGGGILELTLSLLISFFYYRDGAAAGRRLSAVAERLAGTRAQRLLDVAGGTLKAVVYGIIGTAITQGVLAGFGFWLVDVPGALLLGAATAFLSLVPLGPALLWGPAAVWLFYQDALGSAVFLAVWGLLVVGGADNIVKPYFISKGSDLPLLLIFLGILGGVTAFGFLGIFLGPTLLSVGYTLLREWVPTETAPASPAAVATVAAETEEAAP